LLSEACFDALTTNAPVVCEYQVTQDFGPYPVFIRGVPGVYFIDAIERDPMGPFATALDGTYDPISNKLFFVIWSRRTATSSTR
jgi:hypothetical protein